LGFFQAGLLCGQVAFDLDPFAHTVLAGVAGDEALVGQGFEIGFALP
jgi:hypothetical protein